MYRRPYLQIPGPTNIPEPVLNALNHSAINHRGQDFAALLEENVKGLKEIIQTTNDVLIFPASGSGGLEAAVVNVLSPGDKVLAANMGVFSDRFGAIAKGYGAQVTILQVEWGRAVTAQEIEAALAEDTAHEYKAVFLTHNETATGVTTDIAGVRQVMDRLTHPALLMVDAVSSLAITPLATDSLGIDVLISASQKGLMLPGGLAVLAVSEKAWQAHRIAQMPRWYWDFTAMKQKMAVGQMPYTPAINLFFGLKVSLGMLREEGMESVYARHSANARAVRAGVEALGLELLVANPAERSSAVTAVRLPAGVEYKALALAMQEYGVVIGGGLAKLEGKIFRIGHLGMLHEPEVIAVLGVLEMCLHKIGYKLSFGSAVAAAQRVYLGGHTTA